MKPAETQTIPQFWLAGFKSLYLQPADGVLADLGGAGIEFGMSWSTVSAEAGVFWLKGKVRQDSPAFGGLVAPVEIAFDGRIRTYLTHVFGINGFVGFRFGKLKWDYANPVFATDGSRYGDLILGDALNNVTGYFGFGIRPFQMGALDLFGCGCRLAQLQGRNEPRLPQRPVRGWMVSAGQR